jgi:hypothetical protein
MGKYLLLCEIPVRDDDRSIFLGGTSTQEQRVAAAAELCLSIPYTSTWL